MNTELVRVDRTGDVIVFTLANARSGNTITGDMFDAMLAVLREEARHPVARIVRIRAEGDRFCIGRERAVEGTLTIRAEIARLIELKRALREAPAIVVAEVQGDAFGFGFGLAICCDFAVVAADARLGFPEMLFRLPPMVIMSYLTEYALPRHAFPLVLLGEPIAAERALQIGLINEVVPAANLSERVDTLISKLLALDTAAVRNCKEFFRTTLRSSFESNARLALDGLTVASLALHSEGVSH